MASDLQHCAACQEEYVARVASCVECGGPLEPGPLQRGTKASPVPALGGTGPQLDRLLAELPGAQADQAVRALLLEDIGCRVECEGVAKVYEAGQRAAEAFAVTLPVSVYVSGAQYDSAQEILSSLQQEDLIGDQWAAAPVEAEAEASVVDDPGSDPTDDAAPAPDDPEMADGEPVAESTSMRTVVLLVAAGIVLLFLFGR